jgi:XPG N-terminal domain
LTFDFYTRRHATYLLIHPPLLTHTVQGLAGLITKNGFIQTGEIAVLENCGLGIDATHYLNELYTRPAIKSSLSSAIGGVPSAFRDEVERDIAGFKALGTDLLVVFDGFDLNSLGKEGGGTGVGETSRRVWEEWRRLSEKGKSGTPKDREELTRQTREAFENRRLRRTCANDRDVDWSWRGTIPHANSTRQRRPVRCRSRLRKSTGTANTTFANNS